jgi:hypothetical protein
MLLHDAMTGMATGLRRARTAGCGDARRSGRTFPDPEPARKASTCARCGVRFSRTATRWLTCQRCYLANTEVEPIASRAALSPFWTRADWSGGES